MSAWSRAPVNGEVKMLRPARTAGSVKPRRSMQTKLNDRCAPLASVERTAALADTGHVRQTR